MVQTVLGLVFLSTAFIITFLINNIQKYRSLAQEIQAKYIWGTNIDHIPNIEVIRDYQSYRTMRIEIGINILICFGIFTVALSSLLLWAIDIYHESTQEHIWALIILIFLFFVFLFEISQFVSCSGDEGIITIINNIIISPVSGLDIDFREFSRRKIVESKAITRVMLEKKLRKNYLGKILFKISQYANELSFSIISSQFVFFYYIYGLESRPDLLKLVPLIIIIVVYILIQVLYFVRIRNVIKNPLNKLTQ